MRELSFASTGIPYVRKTVQDAIRRCERIIVVGSSDDYHKIYFFTDRKNYCRYYTIDLNAINNLVPKRFQQNTRAFYDEIIHKEPVTYTVNRDEARRLLNAKSVLTTPDQKANATLIQWVKALLIPQEAS